jgi:hypothetical protein
MGLMVAHHPRGQLSHRDLELDAAVTPPSLPHPPSPGRFTWGLAPLPLATKAHALSTRSALAAITARVELGPPVACTSLRDPTLSARTADTLDEIDRGRLILAQGAGYHECEYQASGYPFDHA